MSSSMTTSPRFPTMIAGPSVTVGFDGISGLPTTDLDIRFNNGSFGVVPAFGAPDTGALVIDRLCDSQRHRSVLLPASRSG